ncbi:Rrf2 family transcriptional regulator [uncultured Pseudodesulfovibrio sp.]|uniref:RrF2 family transcriptional regulator n=1 Tax=uncultured Pseudodesulfovibrio sp. TaxID=2035858 RepID=UPI0029C64E3C|nr:Rrf2 family transcriptional regulator [uncultured Pseudodesulfovibrio sp.]
MRLTTRSRYGTRMAIDIAQHCGPGPVRIQDIAERQGVSIKYLEKLIRKLKEAGFVKSKRGPRGGHTLARPASEILMGDMVRVLEGDACLVECRAGTDACDRMDICLTRRLWHEAAEAMYAHLNSVSLADMLRDVEQCAQSDTPPILMD